MHITINDEVFARFPDLESERLMYRSFLPTDAAALFALRTDARVLEYLDTEAQADVGAAEQMIERNRLSFEQKEGLNWVIVDKESQTMIGYAGIWRLDRDHCRGEIGYSLHPDYWRKGYMTETLNCLLRFAFQELHLHSIEANVNIANEASKQLLLKLGFQQEAYFRENYLHNGQFLDSAIFCLLERDLQA